MARRSVIPGAEPWSSDGHGDLADVGIAIIHGFSGNPTSTRPLGERLAADGFRVEVVRLPGHGTHWRDMGRTRYPDWRRAVDEVVSRMAEQCSHVVPFGFSMGGTLVLDVVARRAAAGEGKVAGAAVLNPQVLGRTDPLSRMARFLQFLAPYVPAASAGIRPNDIAKGGDERAYPVIPAKAGYSVVRELPGLRDRLADIAVPVLVLGSQEDHVVPPHNHEWLARTLGERAEYVVLEHSYHVATLDHDADLIAETVRDFARRVTGH